MKPARIPRTRAPMMSLKSMKRRYPFQKAGNEPPLRGEGVTNSDSRPEGRLS